MLRNIRRTDYSVGSKAQSKEGKGKNLSSPCLSSDVVPWNEGITLACACLPADVRQLECGAAVLGVQGFLHAAEAFLSREAGAKVFQLLLTFRHSKPSSAEEASPSQKQDLFDKSHAKTTLWATIT